MTTPRIGAPEWAEGEGAPWFTVDEALRFLEQAANGFNVADKDLTAPPGAEADGDAYIVGGGATGTWAGHDGEIAFFMSTAYGFIAPRAGMTAYVADENTYYQYDGATWLPQAAGAVGGDSLLATEDLDAGDLVNIWSSGGAAKVRKADGANGYDADGFVLADVGNGDPATVYAGGLITGLSGLTPGAFYFLSDTPGEVSDTPGTLSQRVGKALSATSLRFRPETPV